MPKPTQKADHALLNRVREIAASMKEMIDLLDGRISKQELEIIRVAYLILRWFGVRGTRSRRKPQ